ncbi:zona pellucida sperm-binding protein 3-like [Plectropomus leopardus]|uniref:zona pellucida sperm-binding protein 3-like n=1 Tax=Plectropomus leopardus TaxID=160734 RepID=UPI001C4BE701|nr:zona pellucida sperm-binding protein 3-like [Plectropomus leopardus]
MSITGHSASLALLIACAFSVADAIRALKDGPMIDAEGREYKSAPLRADAENISGTKIPDRSPVSLHCTEASMIIMVKPDLYKNGRFLSAAEIFLGEVEHSQNSLCRAFTAGDSEYIIEAGLQDCGSKLTISEDSVIYSNKLRISPAAHYHGITRVTQAEVPVSCHYKRTHFVSSSPHQTPMTLSTPAEHSAAAFTLKLMTDDWTSERLSTVFYLGDLLHLEASYTGPDSGQKRLFIDSCVATLSPDASSVPRYNFIENYGCFTDAKEEGSKALFQPRKRASSLQLQLDTFLFHQDSRNSLFITCELKATDEMWKRSPTDKACNYVHSRWINVDGSDVCRCCDSSCSKGSPYDNISLRHLIPKGIMACGTVTLGPLLIYPGK